MLIKITNFIKQVFKYIPDICDSVTFSREPITIDVKPITYDELYDNEETIVEA